jgi:hypothetical protein
VFAALNAPDPENVDEFIPNSPKYVVDVPRLFDTIKLAEADEPLLVF